MKTGIIKNFIGSWSSGLAYLLIEDCKTHQIEQVPCENGETVRALESCFGNTITEGHTADGEGYKNKKIKWCYDEMGLMLAGFTPA